MKKRADGRYQKFITLPNGKHKVLYSAASTERLAVKDFNEQMMKLERDKRTANQFVSVAERWSDLVFDKIENNTLKSYKPALADAERYFGDAPIEQIMPIDVQRYADYLVARKYAAKTVKNKMAVLGAIFKYALYDEKIIDSDPTTRVRLPSDDARGKREPASEEDEQIIYRSTDLHFGVLALFYLLTGCRKGEAVALTPKDIDLEKRLIHINKTVEWVSSRAYIKDHPKTDAGNRFLPLPEKLVDLIAPLMKQKYIFCRADGNLIDEGGFHRWWKKYQKQTGVKCTPHNLRHSYATILYDAGVDVKTAQLWLGHKDLKTTLEIYTHITNSRKITVETKYAAYLCEKFEKTGGDD